MFYVAYRTLLVMCCVLRFLVDRRFRPVPGGYHCLESVETGRNLMELLFNRRLGFEVVPKLFWFTFIKPSILVQNVGVYCRPIYNNQFNVYQNCSQLL